MGNKVYDARITRIKRALNDLEAAVEQIPRGHISQSALRKIDDNKLVLRIIAKEDVNLAPVAMKVDQAIEAFKGFAGKFNAGNVADDKVREFGRLMNEIAEMNV